MDPQVLTQPEASATGPAATAVAAAQNELVPNPSAPPALPTTVPSAGEQAAAPPPNLNPPPTPRRLWVRLLIWFIIVILLGGIFTLGLAYADDHGWVNTGLPARLKMIPLSVITGGLSPNPSTAGVQVTESLQLTNSFAWTGSLHGYGTASAPLAIGQTSPCDITLQCNSTATTDPLALDTQFVLSTTRQNFDLQTTINDAGVAIKNEYRVVDGQLYIMSVFGSTLSTNSPNVSTTTPAATWIKADQTPEISIDAVKNFLGSALATSRFIAAEQVGTTRTYHYQLSVSGKDIPLVTSLAKAGQTTTWLGSNGPLDIWISRQSHLPVKITVSLTDSAKHTIVLDAVAGTSQGGAIVVPDQVIDPNALLTPDQKRKADLKIIDTALLKYNQEKGSFPVSSAVDHLSKTDSVLSKALVPVYLDKVPSDPSTAHYYGYVSDGSTYELSAVLDDPADPDITKSGSLNLYLVRGPKQ